MVGCLSKVLQAMAEATLNARLSQASINQPDFIYLAALRLDKMTMTYK